MVVWVVVGVSPSVGVEASGRSNLVGGWRLRRCHAVDMIDDGDSLILHHVHAFSNVPL